MMDHFDEALKLIRSGMLEEARIYLEELLKGDPNNIDILYNLGMLFTDLGDTEKAIELLQRCIKLSPNYANAHVAIGFAYIRAGNQKRAKEFTLKAIDIDPNNPFALKNLGGIFGKEGDNLRSIYYFQRSLNANPHDLQTIYGLALAYKESKDFEKADKHFRSLLEMDAPAEIQELARDRLREIAVQSFKAGGSGPRMDAVFYLTDALKVFKEKPINEIKNISSEIGMLGQYGLDMNDPAPKYTINSLPGEFTGLQLVCYMYAGFKQIQPDLDIGIDLSKEYELARRLTYSGDTFDT
jgi:tetratricopeptide (TPR) repeat protein